MLIPETITANVASATLAPAGCPASAGGRTAPAATLPKIARQRY